MTKTFPPNPTLQKPPVSKAAEPQISLPASRFRAGLSARLLLLTGLFVLLAEILIYFPSVATFRNTWLSERISQARSAALILEKTPPDALPKALVDELLSGMETTMIALRIDNTRRLLAISDMPPMVDLEVDLRQRSTTSEIMGAFNTLFLGGTRTIRVIGPPPRGGDFVEIVIQEKPLRDAMILFSWNILQVSLIISGITALLVFAALNGLIVRPVKRLAAAVSRFRTNPADIHSIYRPTPRADELGTLERNVSEMQHALQQELRQREHLANLGLAVAKINHDLRNMLASAQLMADRLGSLPDPNVQRFVPKLLHALDRAITFCQSTLTYGKAQETPPELVAVNLRSLMLDVGEQLMLSPETRPALEVDIPDGLTAEADADHLNRVMTNLIRNARSALESTSPDGAPPCIRVSATGRNGLIEIDIHDNGPGIPARVRDNLFRAFSSSSRPGGTGLGLTIAQELMRGMGGTIDLVTTPQSATGAGTIFRLTLGQA
jgi:signal transduction histidine kinase